MNVKITPVICALFLAAASAGLSAQEIVVIKNVVALTVEDSTGTVVRRIPVSTMNEYTRQRVALQSQRNFSRQNLIRPEYDNPRIEFRDENGRIVNSLSLEERRFTRTVNNLRGEGKKYTVRSAENYYPFVSDNDKYLLMWGGIRNDVVIDPEGKSRRPYEGEKGLKEPETIAYYDTRGNKLFEKTLADDFTVADLLISDNGDIVVISNNNEIDLPDDVRIKVFDRNGNEILVIRRPGGGYYIPNYISPDGKYLEVDDYKNSRFYNLHTLDYWDAPESYRVGRISNNGIAIIYDGPQNREIDLKQYIKE